MQEKNSWKMHFSHNSRMKQKEIEDGNKYLSKQTH